MFEKGKRGKRAELDRQASAGLTNSLGEAKSLPSSGEPITNFTGSRENRELVEEPRSVVEGTTKSLNERFN